MATTTTFFCLFFLIRVNPISSIYQEEEEEEESSFTSLLISQNGLDFAKDILITKGISSLTALQVPQIQKSVNIPLIGNVQVVLSNITVNEINASSTYVKTGDTGVAIVASGATAALTMNWYYSYSTFAVQIKNYNQKDYTEIEGKRATSCAASPFWIAKPILLKTTSIDLGVCKWDEGVLVVDARFLMFGHFSGFHLAFCSNYNLRSRHCCYSGKVEGMEVGLTLGLENQQGTLNLSLMECGCNVKNITINLNGGASWFYQGLVDAFEEQILSAVENSISKKISEGISKLDSLLQSLPKEIPVDDVASLNVTFVNDPLLGDSSIVFEISGLVTARNELLLSSHDHEKLEPLVTCDGSSKMIGISLHEAVFNSGSSVYFNAGMMNWVVEKVGDQSLLNTAGWKYVVPQLYKKYPNDDMQLNISFSSPPVIIISSEKIDVTAHFEMTIDVVSANEIIPVACISVTVVWTFLKTVATPYVNSRLSKGFPLPIIRGFTLENADILVYDSVVSICSDVVFED